MSNLIPPSSDDDDDADPVPESVPPVVGVPVVGDEPVELLTPVDSVPTEAVPTVVTTPVVPAPPESPHARMPAASEARRYGAGARR
jgi:hypothetical protein